MTARQRASARSWIAGTAILILASAAFAPGATAASTAATTPASTSVSGAVSARLPSQSPTSARLELVEQQFATEPDGDIRLRYLLTGLDGDPLALLPPPVSATEIPPTPGDVPVAVPEPPPEPVPLTFLVSNYPPLTDADAVEPLVGSDVDPSDFDDLSGDAVDGVAFDARPLLSRNEDGTVNVTLDIGTDVVDSVETRLKMDRPGLYPLRVQLVAGDSARGDVIATAGTIVQRLPGPNDANAAIAPPIDLSIVTVTPAVPPGADADTRAQATAVLDRALEFSADVDVPVTLEVPPDLVAEVAATTTGAERLASSLVDDELIAMPLLPLDVSSAVAAGRADAYTRLVRAGEDVLNEAVPATPSRRDVWVTVDPLSAGGAQHLRDLGTRFVVIGAELYAETISDDPAPTDRFVEARLPDGGTLPFLVVDPLSAQLTPAAADRILRTSTSTEWGVETLSTMLVEQADEDAATAASVGVPVAPPRRSRILTTPDFTSPDSRLVLALSDLVATTPSLRFTPGSELIGVTDVALDGGQPIVVELPAVAGPSLEARIELLDATALGLASAASMLPAGDPRPAEWSAQLDALISTGYTDADVGAATAALLAEADELKGAVELPDPFAFTLTGRSGEIEVRLTNNSDDPLDVVVGFDASKVDFPGGDQRVTLRPQDETSVIVPVEAEANGTSSINLVVSTPAGEALGEPVTLTARVTALTGLGQVLTGGLVIVLLTWWFTHWRNRRRGALADSGRGRHPSLGKVGSDPL